MPSLFKLVMKPHQYITEKYLEHLRSKEYFKVLEEAAQLGVEALYEATPKRTGKTAASWSYKIEVRRGSTKIYWINDNLAANGEPIAILLQYGHGTGRGGYVQGRDYINPAIKPVFDNISEVVWKAVMQDEQDR